MQTDKELLTKRIYKNARGHFKRASANGYRCDMCEGWVFHTKEIVPHFEKTHKGLINAWSGRI